MIPADNSLKHFRTSDLNFTYLLGAGASAEALSIIKSTETQESMSERMKILSTSLNQVNVSFPYSTLKNKISSDLLELGEQSAVFGTPDTYAKFLYTTKQHDKLKDLKRALAFYFMYEQFVLDKRDKRAAIFLTTLLDNTHIFPPNIKIINWNYDLQIQMAAWLFNDEMGTFAERNGVQKFTRQLLNIHPETGKPHWHKPVEYSSVDMLQLNGIAGYVYSNQADKVRRRFRSQKFTLEQLLEEMAETDGADSTRHELITFGWENLSPVEGTFNTYKDRLFSMIHETDILVIIGYSFPYFNRLIDKTIFEALKSGGRLSKIYFQDPERNGDFLYSQFAIDIERVDIEHIDKVDNYYIPYEL